MCNTKEGRALPRLYMNSCKKLGIDIGSTTVKVSIIEDGGKLLFADYKRHFANIQETLADLLREGEEKLGALTVEPVITGSGGLTLSSIWAFHLSRRLWRLPHP